MTDSQTAAVATAKTALYDWMHEHWTRLYGLLSDRYKKRINKKAFVDKYRGLAQVEKLVDYKIVNVEIKSDHDVFVSLELMMLDGPDTSFFPTQGWRHETVKTTWHLIRNTHNKWKLNFDQRHAAR